jgi:type I restriction enzyme M protein
MTTALLQAEEQTFLNTLEKKLWTSANKLLPSLDASQYKHVMLGLVFIKYVSDAFDIRREQLKTQLLDPKHDYVLTPGRYVGAAAEEDDGEPFSEKMARLTGQLKTQFKESDRLETEIKKNLAGLCYEL